METQKAIHSVVENIPGFCQLKPEQEECLVNILNGDYVVALLPTGFGKVSFDLSIITDRQRETTITDLCCVQHRGVSLFTVNGTGDADNHSLVTFLINQKIRIEKQHKNVGLHSLPGILYKQPSVLVGRTDVVSVTPWLAPIIWEGMFDPSLIDSIYKQQNITIATTVFALGKYTRFLKDFLESAEQHYFVGFRVHYYLFTDQPEAVPDVKLSDEHQLTVRKVPSMDRWQDISMGRMEILEKLTGSELENDTDYIFCLDVDAKFYGRWGAETLGRLVGVIHPWFYTYPRDKFTYESRPESQAFIPAEEGDYYYTAAAFGGTVQEVYELTKTCREQQSIDAAKSIEAMWLDESHLNKYLLYNKPSKLLSPEYLWRDINASTEHVKIIRLTHVTTNYATVRPNM